MILYPVAVFLCAPGKEEHIQLLTDIATLFEDEEFLDAAVNFEILKMYKLFIRFILMKA